MKILDKVLFWTMAISVMLAAVTINIMPSQADTGHEGATRKEIGSFGEMYKYTGSSIAGTSFFEGTVKRPDGFCYNNTVTEVWVGSVTATQRGSASFLHDNINFGLPWKSSATFGLDGSFTGSWNFTCAPGVSTCEVRCIEGKVR